VIPARPMYLNIPLNILQDHDKSVEELNNEVKLILNRRRLTHMPTGSILERRRYEEELYVFEDH
jgi:hypothetical protein